jgi:hypothetical protein
LPLAINIKLTEDVYVSITQRACYVLNSAVIGYSLGFSQTFTIFSRITMIAFYHFGNLDERLNGNVGLSLNSVVLTGKSPKLGCVKVQLRDVDACTVGFFEDFELMKNS